MKLISYSKEDHAGTNIAKILVEKIGFKKTSETFDKNPIYEKGDTKLIASEKTVRELEEVPFNPEVMFVASRHRSKSEKPTLTTHVTGNFGKAEMGGEDGKLCVAPALWLRESFLSLSKNNKNEKYSVTLEVTHHGPTELPFPLIFIEVGSSEEQWQDVSACEVVAKTISELLTKNPEKVPVGIGFGGPHYAPNFNPIMGKITLGHIMPKHAMAFLDKKMVEQMLQKTIPKPELAVIDWKGMQGDERKILINLLDELKIPYRKTSELKN